MLRARGLSLGDYPPGILGSSLGGLIGVRTPGKSSARHGFFEEAVAGVSAVLADGRTIHTRIAPRRATGPDLARALCGSEGTLGVITGAVLKLYPAPRSVEAAWVGLPSPEAALELLTRAQERAGPAVTGFELMPRHRKMFLEGLDSIGLSLTYQDQIAAFADAHWARQPWVRDVAATTKRRL